jgi:hypothetical protein
MTKPAAVTVLLVLASLSASARRGPLNDPLLDRLVGTWVLQGTIGGQQTTHDIQADWVLAHGYVRLHEVSREKGADGSPFHNTFVYDRQADSWQWLMDGEQGGTLVPFARVTLTRK